MREAGTVDYLFVIPSSSVHRIQEAQTTTYHVLWALTAASPWGLGRSTEHGGRGPVTKARRVRVRGSLSKGSCREWGFRPFVHCAGTLSWVWAGIVGNDTTGVFVEVEGPSGRNVARFSDFPADPGPSHSPWSSG